MFPSSNNGTDPFYSYYEQQQVYNSRPFSTDITFTSKQSPSPNPLSSYHMPSPFITFDQSEFQDFDLSLHQNLDFALEHQQQSQQQPGLLRSFVSETTNTNAFKNKKSLSRNNNSNTATPPKRTSKRDRHSKINTAQGPRDRRMRLSLKVARDFFDLQDKLCFDKASKTVEWLLREAAPAISNLYTEGGIPRGYNYSSSVPSKSASCTSEVEEVSGNDESTAIKEKAKLSSSSSSSVNKKRIKKAKTPRKTSYHHPLARETREKARARARERTIEKRLLNRKIDESKLRPEARNQESNRSITRDKESGNTNNQSLDMQLADDQMEVQLNSHQEKEHRFVTTTNAIESMNMIYDSLVIMGKLSPYSTGFPQEHQITDFQSVCKLWEAY